ncbi:MAG: response regulator transcription factor [Bacteroidota bacterium]
MNTKLKCLLLDDELKGLTYLKMLCEEIPGLEVVKAFSSPDRFLAEFQDLDADLCILDIEMPGISGLEVAKRVGKRMVIFTTAYKEYAAEAFDLDVVDYVRKPVTLERLTQAVQKAVQRKPAEPATPPLTLNTDKGRAVIPFGQLLYIRASEIDSRDKVAQFQDSHQLTLKNISFEKLQELLPGDEFVRINKKEIIALKIVHAFSAGIVTVGLPDDAGKTRQLSLSEVYRKEFITRLKV